MTATQGIIPSSLSYLTSPTTLPTWQLLALAVAYLVLGFFWGLAYAKTSRSPGVPKEVAIANFNHGVTAGVAQKEVELNTQKAQGLRARAANEGAANSAILLADAAYHDAMAATDRAKASGAQAVAATERAVGLLS